MLNSKKFYVILIGIVVSLSIISFIVTFVSIKVITENNIKEFKNNVLLEKKSELLDRINIVYKIIESNYHNTLIQERIENSKKISVTRINTLFSILSAYYEKHKNDKNLKENLKLIIENASFDKKKFYFWINDLTPKMILNPIQPELNNKYVGDYKDPKNNYVFREILKIIKKNKEGFVTYYWLNPKNHKIEKKLSYVKLCKTFDWVIGTGVYFSDNTREIQQKTLEEIKNATFGKNGYFWVNDMNYKMIMHPIKPEYDGKVFINTPKVPFVELGVNELKKTQKDFAFITYKFYDPATKKYGQKLSIVKLFKPWGWVIGTGVYLVDIDDSIQKIRKESHKEVIKIIEILVIINLVVIFIILVISRSFINKYEELATKDKLTNIFNRLKIDTYLQNQVEECNNSTNKLSLIFFDIDHFKQVNDTYGHKVGDYVLQEISKVISNHIRKDDFFGRWGGEEFLIILPNIELEEAVKVAEKLRKVIENHTFREVGKITCSFGVVSCKKSERVNEIIERVDTLLYKAKENGRNRVESDLKSH